MKNIWIVSWYDYGEPAVVTAFDNKETAMRYYDYELGRCCHEKVDVDECPVYSTMQVCSADGEKKGGLIFDDS